MKNLLSWHDYLTAVRENVILRWIVLLAALIVGCVLFQFVLGPRSRVGLLLTLSPKTVLKAYKKFFFITHVVLVDATVMVVDRQRRWRWSQFRKSSGIGHPIPSGIERINQQKLPDLQPFITVPSRHKRTDHAFDVK